jgi:Leucine-rich repeat (LRR) protein
MARAPIQGLRVSLNLADAQNTVDVLKNLNLDIRDLDRIRGLNDEGVDSADIRSLSGLTIDLEKEAVGIYNEVQSYENILTPLNDGRRRIAGNIDVSGKIVAPSFKFSKLDDVGNITAVDFSTSRSSAWSAFGNPADSVFYGGDVIITGPSSTIELSSLEFINEPSAKRFESQIPTHKIRVSIDGEAYDLYAMKGIPIRFRGFFRSVRNMQINFNILNNLRPSWIIRNTDNDQESVFQNRISGSGTNRQSTVSFFSSSAKQRDIEFYYPVNSITSITLDNTNVYDVPNVELTNLASLSLVNSDLIEMPDTAAIYPNLTTLNLSGSDLTRSDTETLRTFSPEVINRINNGSLTTLILDKVYSNDCTADLGEISSLRSYRAGSVSTNSRRMTGTSPAIGPNLLSYDISGNNFTTLHPSIQASENLQSLNIRSNNISSAIDALTGNNLAALRSFISGANSHPIVNVSSKTNLQQYVSDNSYFTVDSVGTNIITNCTNLTSFVVYNTNISGTLMNFGSNTSLQSINLQNTLLSDASSSYSIADDTFGPVGGGCRNTLRYFNLQSRNLIKEMHPDAFKGMTALTSLTVRSNGNGIDGAIPVSLGDCYSLRSISFSNNKMTGNIPNFAANRSLSFLDLSFNQFNGLIPSITSATLRTLRLNNNLFTGFQTLDCQNLTYINASNNLLSQIPLFELAVRIRTIILNNNPGMTYIPGSLETITSLRGLDMANCGISRGSIDRILVDLNKNYDLNPRRNIRINLVGNSSPSATEEITTIINRLRREGWQLGLD